MAKGDRENFKADTVMTKDQIKEHNSLVIKKYGLAKDMVLKGYIPKKVTPFLREYVLRRDKFICKKCGINGLENLEVEFDIHHVVPISQGGLNIPDNLITLCTECHHKTHGKK